MSKQSYANRVNSRRIIEGPSDSLMAVSPLKHKWAWDILDVMEANTWFAREIDLSRDIKDYNTVLTAAEKSMYDKALAFLSNLDGIQFNNLISNIGQHITSPEVSMCVSRQAWEEAVHVKAYSTMIEAIALDPSVIYMTFERDKVLAAKNEYIMQQSAILSNEYTSRNFALAVVANVILEGIYFFSGFLAFYVLAKNGKMLNSADMIRYIQRDEEKTHLVLFVNIFHALKQERPELFDAEFYESARELFKTAVELECAWGRHIIKGGVLGVTDSIVNDYIRYLANERLAMIGMDPLYPGVKNPVAWVERFSEIDSVEANFFESKPTSYAVGGTLEWDS
ncbi:ribonucleotide-diphosphate reductase subunit beta [Ferrovum sp.]|uniref:ribonucleotide-diphosphate reductase subunit beta n=1 Tax=Ferrovum sp. TaxID=2609467 RepID=UPI00262A7709|nr:ribonucleotide-diphosphate reductase subunit beta [Ferrovum sp.]